MHQIKAFSNGAALVCAGAFALMVATAVSNFLRIDIDTGTATLVETLGQFAVPAIPLGLVLALLALRSQAAATLVAMAATLFYLVSWVTL